MERLPLERPTASASSALQASAIADLALERAPFGLSFTSVRPETFGEYVFANPAYCRISGYSLEELKVVRFRDIVHPDDLPGALVGLASLMSGEVGEIDTELRLRRRDGSSITVRQHRTAITDDAGKPLWTMTHTEDISDRKESDAARSSAEAALRVSETRYRLLADHAADMIVCTRADRTRSYVSPASQRVVGYSPAEILGLDFATFLHPDDNERVMADYAQFVVRGGSEKYTYRLRHKDGHYVWVEAHWVHTFDAALAYNSDSPDNAGVVVSIVRDISERKAAEMKIATMARHDELTGLANRILLRERLDEARAFVESGGSAAVLSVDLDNFKSVNDTLGHAVGDALLQGVAERLLRCVRQTDTVARLGGDEFIVVILGLDNPRDGMQRGQAIVDALGERYDVGGHQILVSASVGVTMSPRDGTLPDRLLKNADIAMYRAKADGRRACRLFEPGMAVDRDARLEIEGELRDALAAESFEIFYQPIVSVATTALVGFEALLRWRHPVRGLVYPNDFIPVAEDTGLIVPLGEWVLRDACRRASQWPAGVRLSVNVSPIQFRNARFVETVRNALAESGLPGHRLDIEITESVLLQECDATLAALNTLRRMGVGISLDDFGTGYSSLSYLRNFRFDRIKIDRSFVGDLLQRPESGAIVQAVVGIGHALGISTVAEGVETRAQLQRLRIHGCTEAQGFLFSKARPADEIAAMLAAFPTPRSETPLLAFA